MWPVGCSAAAAPPAAMAETADAAASGAESYIGSFISLITKSDIRYERFLFQLNAQDSTIALRNVETFGTEQRRLDGSQVAMTDKIYEHMYFKRSDIKDLQVVSLPSVRSTPIVPDDPAIIQLHRSHPPSTTISMDSTSTMGGTNLCSSAQVGNQVPPFQANMISLQSVEMSGSWASVFPASPVNLGLLYFLLHQ